MIFAINKKDTLFYNKVSYIIILSRIYYYLIFLQYCVQSLSVHSEHLREVLVISLKRSGNIITQSSHIKNAINEIINNDIV